MYVSGRGIDRVWIEPFDREEFFRERWTLGRGEHATILAPTGWGKTRLMGDLLAHTISPTRPVARLALKGEDLEMRKQCKALGIKVARRWPPMVVGKPNGWALWPTESEDPDADDTRWAEEVRRFLLWVRARMRGRQRKGLDGIVIDADEMEEIQRLLAVIGRSAMLRGIYRRWRAAGISMLAGCQAPKYLVTDAYSQARHLLIGNDPDLRNRQRYGEIGGVDPKLVEYATLQLEPFHFLYIGPGGPRGRVMAVVGA